MRTILLAAAVTAIAAGGAFAQTAKNTDPSCGASPCPAAPSGSTTTSGPEAVRDAPVDSPVGTGSGTSTGKTSEGAGGGGAGAGAK